MKRSITITLFVCLCAIFLTAQAFAQQAQEGAAQQQQQAGQQELQVGEFLKLSELMDKEVKDQAGQEIGSIKDVLVSQEGEAKYLIFSHEDKMIPVPWEAAKLQVQQDEVTAQIDQQRLAAAPSFEEGQWPQFETNYEQEIHTYYGTEMRQPGMPGAQPGMQPGTQQPGMQPGMQQERETPRQ
jgi:sporulation protein YlmC with PRC-barrel domain